MASIDDTLPNAIATIVAAYLAKPGPQLDREELAKLIHTVGHSLCSAIGLQQSGLAFVMPTTAK